MLWSIWESRHWCLKGNALWAFRKQVTLICWVLHIIDRWYQGRTVTKSWFFTPCSQGWRKICSRVCFQQAGTVILGGLGFFLLLVFSFCLLRKHCAALPIFASRGTEAKKKRRCDLPSTLQADHTGAISGFPEKGCNTSLRVRNAPSRRDPQCIFISTETCTSQTPKVTVSGCAGKRQWHSVNFPLQGSTRWKQNGQVSRSLQQGQPAWVLATTLFLLLPGKSNLTCLIMVSSPCYTGTQHVNVLPSLLYHSCSAGFNLQRSLDKKTTTSTQKALPSP